MSDIPTSRLGRLARMASLTARTASGLAVGRAKRALGDEGFEHEKQAARRLLETLGTMKGAAMKLGQQLAMDAGNLSPEAREIVGKLFAQAPAASYEDIAGQVERELGGPPEAVFATFEREPLASASLGQVHRATLADGTRVAVKVQYPGVAEALVSDLQNAAMLVRVMNGASRALAEVDARPYYAELQREIGAETDYLREARLGAAFAEAVSTIPELHVPRGFPELSTSRVLTTELVEGVTLAEFAKRELSASERFRVGRQLTLATLVPVLRRELVHGDPHPGNFLVRPDGRLTVLDFGAVKQLSAGFVTNFWKLVREELAGREPDLLATFQAAGFTLRGEPAQARETLSALHAFASAPVRQAEFDWADGAVVAGIKAQIRAHPREVFEIELLVESLLFYRAMGGLSSNLARLQSRGPYRAVCAELDALRVP